MSDLVTPGEVDAEIDSTSAGHAMGKAGTGAWIVDGADIAGAYSSLDETVLNAFAYNTTDSSGLDAVIDPGEAYVGGWLCRDVQTTVTLPASDTTDIYVGYDASAILSSGTAPADNENIIVGLDGAFAAEDPRTHIWTFATDGSSIIDSLDERQLQKPIEFDPNAGLTANADLTIAGSTTFNSTILSNIDMGANNVDNVSRVTSHASNALIEMAGGPSNDSPAIHTGGTGSSFVRLWDRSNSQPILQANEGGNVEIPNGSLEVSDDFTQFTITEADTGSQWFTEVSNGNLNLADADNSGHIRALSGGDVEIPNGVIDSSRGTACVSGSERYIFVSSGSPSDSQGQDGDIWIEH